MDAKQAQRTWIAKCYEVNLDGQYPRTFENGKKQRSIKVATWNSC
jgi:hypothetical protein